MTSIAHKRRETLDAGISYVHSRRGIERLAKSVCVAACTEVHEGQAPRLESTAAYCGHVPLETSAARERPQLENICPFDIIILSQRYTQNR